MKTFRIIPILGQKTDVLPDDPAMFQMAGEGVALTHAAGGKNYSLKRTKNACVKSLGQAIKSNTANAQKTLCMGMFELYDGTNRNLFFFDNGKVYKYDASWDPAEVVVVTTPVLFAKDSGDLYSIIRVGAYIVWADRAENEPHKWKHGDANSTTLMYNSNAAPGSTTVYKFRYLGSFQRRVIGLYSDQTNGNIDIRWSSDWPTTAITALNFPAANQLWVPNDDPITGGASLGRDKYYIFCENSIQQLVYYPDYSTPFRAFTTVPHQGCASHHSIVGANGLLYFYNENYGFCSYNGGNTIIPISDDILTDLQSMTQSYLPKIVGKHIPPLRQIHWTVPLDGNTECNYILIYNYDTGQWEIEDKVARWIDYWQLYTSMTWTQLEAAVGGTGLWSDAGSATWADYIAAGNRPVYGKTDGHLYMSATEASAGSDMNGYREEPIISFGNSKRYDTVQEIWFDIGGSGGFNIDISYRTGNTTGEIIGKPFESLGAISCNNPSDAKLHINKNARLHQLRWGTDNKDQKFTVSGIDFKYIEGTEI